MNDHTAELGRAVVPALPDKVLVRTSRLIDREDALSLSKSSKGLAEAGEMRIWRTIVITSGREGTPSPTPISHHPSVLLQQPAFYTL